MSCMTADLMSRSTTATRSTGARSPSTGADESSRLTSAKSRSSIRLRLRKKIRCASNCKAAAPFGSRSQHRRIVDMAREFGQCLRPMSVNTFGRVFRFTTWGESHGPALGAVVDGCPPALELGESDIQPFLDARKPGTSKFTTQRREADLVKILSGTFEGKTTGTPISLLIENTDQRSKDYSEVAKAYRPGHADYAYDAKYGFRDYR